MCVYVYVCVCVCVCALYTSPHSTILCVFRHFVAYIVHTLIHTSQQSTVLAKTNLLTEPTFCDKSNVQSPVYYVQYEIIMCSLYWGLTYLSCDTVFVVFFALCFPILSVSAFISWICYPQVDTAHVPTYLIVACTRMLMLWYAYTHMYTPTHLLNARMHFYNVIESDTHKRVFYSQMTLSLSLLSSPLLSLPLSLSSCQPWRIPIPPISLWSTTTPSSTLLWRPPSTQSYV